MVVLGEGGRDAPGSNLGLEVSSYTTIVEMNTISQTLYNHNSITSTLIQGVSEPLLQVAYLPYLPGRNERLHASC